MMNNFKDGYGVMPDKWIRAQTGMITPFLEKQSNSGIISYGLSSYGYDVRVGKDFKVFTNVNNTIVDPKSFDSQNFVEKTADTCIIPPNSFILCSTIERLKIPRDVLVICIGKSTYARCGIVVNITPLEPEWEGEITIEISNTTPNPAKIYANEGIAQLVFLKATHPCETSYGDRQGKYMNQTGVTLPKVCSKVTIS